MWAVLYDDGTSLTTVSEPIARSLAEAERQRGHRVTVRRLDDDADSAPEPVRRAEPSARPEPVSESEPAPAPEPVLAPEPAQKVESAQTVEPAQAVEPARAGGTSPGVRADPRTRTGPCAQAYKRPQAPALRARRRQHRRRGRAGRSLGCAAQSGCHDQLQPGAGQQPSPSSAAAASAGSAAGHALQQRSHGEQPGAAGLSPACYPVVGGGWHERYADVLQRPEATGG